MIKKLQRKFIMAAMCSVTLVVALIIGMINIANYNNINQSGDALLTILEDNNGVFPKNNMMADGSKPPVPDMSPEAPFQTRYFTVEINEKGVAVKIDTGKIAAISTKEAVAYGMTLYEAGSTSGFIGCYKYRAIENGENTMYIFLDVEQDLENFYSFLFVSVLVSIIGLLLVFILLLIISRKVINPIALSYEKQKRFITDASHEIKTPLTVIDANAEVLEMENGENEWTSSIKKQVEKLTKLTEKLVFLARMDEENKVVTMVDFSLSDAIEETAQSFKAVADTQNKSFHVKIEKNISYCGDENAIRQLIVLLLENAMKYSDASGNILLQLRKNGKNREIIVKNTVDEIEKGNLNILFERFYRRDASRNAKTGGSGIGLSVAKAIVEVHKGKITAKSEDGKQIEFKIIL